MKYKKKKSLYPSMICIFVFINFIYYWNIIKEGQDTVEISLIYISIISSVFGYFIFRKKSKKIIDVKYNYELMYRLSILLIVIGLGAHFYYYKEYLGVIRESYGASYEIGRGKGYITVFFDLLPIGLMFLFQSNKKVYNKRRDLIGFLITIFYALFYLFILKKRRQIIFLVIGITIVRFKDFLLKHKGAFYIGALLIYVGFVILGQARGYFSTHSLKETITYVCQNINIDWFLISNLEGKYISMILHDVVNYVDFHGINYTTLLGAVLVFIPRSIFEIKPLAFPEWYTYNFHWGLYLKGYGFAGSLLGEVYLIGSWPFVIVFFTLLGVLLYKADRLIYKGLDIMYVISLYIIIMIPRLDLGSLFIFLVSMYLPSYIVYKLCKSKNINSKEDYNEKCI